MIIVKWIYEWLIVKYFELNKSKNDVKLLWYSLIVWILTLGANINNYEIYETVGNDQPVAYEVPEHSTNESLYSEANNVHNSVSNAIYMYQCVDSKNSHGKLPVHSY